MFGFIFLPETASLYHQFDSCIKPYPEIIGLRSSHPSVNFYRGGRQDGKSGLPHRFHQCDKPRPVKTLLVTRKGEEHSNIEETVIPTVDCVGTKENDLQGASVNERTNNE